MRGYLASSITAAACAALVLPLALPSGAQAAPERPTAVPVPGIPPDGPASTGRSDDSAQTPAAASPADAPASDTPAADSDTTPAATSADAPGSDTPADGLKATPGVPGSTQSLPLTPRTRAPAPGGERVLRTTDVTPFSLAGVVWPDPDAELRGTVRVRTRSAATGRWSLWQSVETHQHEHGADPDTRERRRPVRGATAPLWVGPSDAVEVRVRPAAGKRLPTGLRLDLVDPGEASAPAGRGLAVLPASAAPRRTTAAPQARTVRAATARTAKAKTKTKAKAAPFVGPRPRIVTRKGWGANESLRQRGFVYTQKVKAAFVHHSATGNGYTCNQTPSVLRGIYRYHVVSSGWRDIGYNFAVDKCGNIYEGRAGGVGRPVLGAHTLGFNRNSMGIAVIGTYSRTTPPAAAVNGVARLTAWKIGLDQGNPRGKTTLTSGGSGKHRKGKKVRFNVISGHRDGFSTDCPGTRLYKKLPATRSASARLQGRG
ncbi:N-acetylmuramoyl-L-alanine amidase [Streptomyces sp. NPDC057638]|uniref:peptidoglycan recognition protein family protein n=1 Tax=Streptomyces sp. NPDC057638 TaxID=3346190 RepID=UPI0036AAEBEC